MRILTGIVPQHVELFFNNDPPIRKHIEFLSYRTAKYYLFHLQLRMKSIIGELQIFRAALISVYKA